MAKPIIIASNNTMKSQELIAIFDALGYKAINYRQLLAKQEFPAETTDSPMQNAIQKAKFIHDQLADEYVLGDDSTLHLAAFPDRFGVTTKRQLSRLQLKNTSEENDYLLKLLANQNNRSGYLQAYFALMTPNDQLLTSKNRGGVAFAVKAIGDQQKGFAEILLAENGLTLAQMSIEQRIEFSHRGRASKELLDKVAGTIENKLLEKTKYKA